MLYLAIMNSTTSDEICLQLVHLVVYWQQQTSCILEPDPANVETYVGDVQL